VIKTKKGDLTAAVAGMFVDEKAKVQASMKPILRESVAKAYSKIMLKCQQWEAEARGVNQNHLYARSEYSNGVEHNHMYGLKGVGSNKKDEEWQQMENSLISAQEFAKFRHEFEQKVTILHCIIAVLVVLLIVSWLYIALTFFYFERPESHTKREVDLERGEGPAARLSRKLSRRSMRKSVRGGRRPSIKIRVDGEQPPRASRISRRSPRESRQKSLRVERQASRASRSHRSHRSRREKSRSHRSRNHD